MSTDKTLADAQPGGRVRLGDRNNGLAVSLRQIADAQYTRRQSFNGRLPADVQEVIRMAAYALETQPNYITDAYELGMRDGQHLSAQTSPGGQDASFPWEKFHAYLIDKCEGDTISEEGLQQALAAMAKDERYCLAARQPVGESVARLVEAVEGECNGLAISRTTAKAILAHVFPTGQVATAYMVDGRIEQGLFFDRAAAETMAAMNAGEVVPLFRSPAQAVDLGQFRDVALIAQQAAFTPEEKAKATRLLALIDSQAVGK